MYVAIVLFLLAFAVPVTVYSIVSGEFDIRNRASDEGNEYPPKIVSVPVTVATVGREYTYLVKALDSDLSDVSSLDFIVDQSPTWLEWDPERKMFSGTPQARDIGDSSVTLKVSDGKWLGTQKFTITVSTAEIEEPVNGSEQNSSAGSEQGEKEQPPEEVEGIEAQVYEPVVQDVLGAEDAQLPDTAGVGLFMGISLSFAILVLAGYLWLDARYRLTDRIFQKIEYALGRQTSFQFEDGLVVKRRKSKL